MTPGRRALVGAMAFGALGNSLHALAATPVPVGISGGMIVAEVLSADGARRFSAQQIALARDVGATTVGLDLFDTQGRSAGACSASIVHERVVLTAAHCVMAGQQVRTRITVVFEGGGGMERREAIDVAVHPAFLKLVRGPAFRPETQDLSRFLRTNGAFSAADLALLLLHRPVPASHRPVGLVAPGYRDSAATTKVIAGYGIDYGARGGALALRFAEISGTSLRAHQGEITGGDELVLESKFRGGTRISTCKGDSGGPVFVRDRASGRQQQIGVSSAADERCREVAVSASIDGQRTVLRQMFRYLTDGDPAAAGNPF